MIKIKFGTDGWRAIIADDFTVDNVKRVASATATWLKQSKSNKSVAIGYDCRFGGKLFAQAAASVLAAKNIKVFISPDFVSTPMLSLTACRLDAVGIIITASHNPPDYNGYKLKGAYGGPALPAVIEDIENLIPADFIQNIPPFEQMLASGQIEYFDMEEFYYRHAEKAFDMASIRNSHLHIAYDAMFGAGQRIVKRLLPQALTLHAEYNPGFLGQAPEPIEKNLQPFVEMIQAKGNIDFAFATDGDADRIGIFDKEGIFIDSHHLILMLIQYLYKIKDMTGEIASSFSCTDKIGKMCNAYGLKHIVTKIGFKYICGYMLEEDILVGGEESGGIAIKGHIPERDGVWVALTLLEYMAKSGKTLKDLIADIYAVTGPFALERYDLHIAEGAKQELIKALKEGLFSSFGKYTVQSTEDLDGYKFHLDKDSWVMIRPSGTEPVLRIYAQASSYRQAIEILNATRDTLFHTEKIA